MITTGPSKRGRGTVKTTVFADKPTILCPVRVYIVYGLYLIKTRNRRWDIIKYMHYESGKTNVHNNDIINRHAHPNSRVVICMKHFFLISQINR